MTLVEYTRSCADVMNLSSRKVYWRQNYFIVKNLCDKFLLLFKTVCNLVPQTQASSCAKFTIVSPLCLLGEHTLKMYDGETRVGLARKKVMMQPRGSTMLYYEK